MQNNSLWLKHVQYKPFYSAFKDFSNAVYGICDKYQLDVWFNCGFSILKMIPGLDAIYVLQYSGPLAGSRGICANPLLASVTNPALTPESNSEMIFYCTNQKQK